MLLPETHELGRWGAEPFVLAADVSSAPGHEGEAGWSWYTGSAGWFFRIVAEDLLGLRLRNGELEIRPLLPDWEAHIQGRRIAVENGSIVEE